MTSTSFLFVQVWMSYAQFESSVALEEEIEAAEQERDPDNGLLEDQQRERDARTRAVYERAHESLKAASPDLKEERVLLLEAWRDFEQGSGPDAEKAQEVEAKMPKKVKRKRPNLEADNTPQGMEEYYDYIFPNEAGGRPNLKILEAAYR
ncbi:crooked neck protein [Klebsormidium nitens]|uniref:Crooked neck protein n=1 Tax=Klebsormidium nitens TaxID=105231 RepID=A0A1Y1IJJ7_KLENI|nr:crooked neck protein [Klebsormidium nitens]|eukprot:GAQ90302.1 crooked neck protein [Klebsormidium nitens]